MSTSKEQREELRRLANLATPGPWWIDRRHGEVNASGKPGDDWYELVCEPARDEDGAFIVYARAQVVALCDHVDALEAKAAQLQARIDRAAEALTTESLSHNAGEAVARARRALSC